MLNIWSYNENSEGAKALAAQLGIKRIRHNNSKYKAGRGKVIINWGDSNLPKALEASRIINSSYAIGVVSNKLKFFELVNDTNVRTPDWTTDIKAARAWQAEGSIVVERHKLTGHSAEGVRIVEKELDIQKAPLYTRYTPKKDEYRVHFVGDEIIYVQQKKRRLDVPDEDINWQVRNHDNGFIYAREGVIVPDDVTEQAKNCIKACALDFGAIDIIYNQKQRQAYVLEVNSAPGIEGQSVIDYAAAFKRFING